MNNENLMNDNLFTFKKKERNYCKKNGSLRAGESEFLGFEELMSRILNLEKKTEKLKQDLALRPDFNLLDFFVIFDKDQKGFLDMTEIEEMFLELKIKLNKNDVMLFLMKFDHSDSGKLK